MTGIGHNVINIYGDGRLARAGQNLSFASQHRKSMSTGDLLGVMYDAKD